MLKQILAKPSPKESLLKKTDEKMEYSGQHVDILLRTCNRVDVASAPSTRRLLNKSKEEVLFRCLISLCRAIVYCQQQMPECYLTLTVLDDHSDAQTVATIKQMLKGLPIDTSFKSIHGTGNGESIKENYHYALEQCSGLIYFCEDDYLHAPNALVSMIKSYNKLSESLTDKIILHPYDCPDRYLNPLPHGQYPCEVYLGSDRHWRTVKHTTGTFLTHYALLKRYWHHYIAFAQYGIDPDISEDNTINLIYEEVPCLSPMPSLAVHLQYVSTLSPFVKWQKW